MEESAPPGAWTCAGSIVTVESPWVRLLAERWTDDRGASLEYWRVERAHSALVMPVWRGRLLLPRPQFRPGVGRATLDLPGGRVPPGATPEEAAPALLRKELGLAPESVIGLRALDPRGWIVNSSFSNQLVYGLVATIDDGAAVDEGVLHSAPPCTISVVAALARELECLQCRAVLMAWLLDAA